MRSGLTTARRRVRFELWSYRGQFPTLYLPAARWKHRRAVEALARERSAPVDLDSSPPPVLPGTDIVIEGFPRSGNTFAVEAFRSAQGVIPLIAHHHHVPAQVIAGAKNEIPTLLLIRDPDDAVLSYVIRYPHLTTGQALRHYVRFYSRCMPYRERVLTATFEEVTNDMGAVTLRINDRFGTTFTAFEHSETNVERAFAVMQKHERTVLGGTERFDAMTSRPSTARADLKESLRSRLSSPKLRRLRAKAGELFGSLTE